MGNYLVSVIFVALVSGAVGGLISLTYFSDNLLSTNDRIKEFYLTETSVLVSPHGLRGRMDKGDDSFILVDLRSPEEYEREHIIGAINIPAYKDPYTSAYGDVDRIVGEFSKLSKDKEIISYCYSVPCMTGRKIGRMLAEHDIYIKELGVGWNEWRYFWTLWNHEHEWNVTNVNNYVISGPEPGVLIIINKTDICGFGEFSC